VKASGVSRATAYRFRGHDRAFAEAWDDAIEEAVDMLELEAHRRAIEGSDRLLMFVLRALRPEKYRENAPRPRPVQEKAAKTDMNLEKIISALRYQPILGGPADPRRDGFVPMSLDPPAPRSTKDPDAVALE
jgi:hypothetical protein